MVSDGGQDRVEEARGRGRRGAMVSDEGEDGVEGVEGAGPGAGGGEGSGSRPCGSWGVVLAGWLAGAE